MASRCLALTAKACLWSYHRKAHQELLFVFVHAWSNAKTWSESFLVLADAGYLTPPHLRSQWVGALDMSQQFSVGMTTFLFLLSLCSTHIPPPTSLRLQVLNPHTPGSYQILWPPDGMHSHLLRLLSPAISSPPPPLNAICNRSLSTAIIPEDWWMPQVNRTRSHGKSLRVISMIGQPEISTALTYPTTYKTG